MRHRVAHGLDLGLVNFSIQFFRNRNSADPAHYSITFLALVLSSDIACPFRERVSHLLLNLLEPARALKKSCEVLLGMNTAQRHKARAAAIQSCFNRDSRTVARRERRAF